LCVDTGEERVIQSVSRRIVSPDDALGVPEVLVAKEAEDLSKTERRYIPVHPVPGASDHRVADVGCAWHRASKNRRHCSGDGSRMLNATRNGLFQADSRR
jgi:hypothetical protein